MNKIVLLLCAAVSIMLFTACDSKSDDLEEIHKQKIADGFKHYHIRNQEGKEYNLIMMVMVDNAGNVRIGAAGHALEARDTGDFDVYIKIMPDGFLLHYLANDNHVKWGGGNLPGITAYAAAPEPIKKGDYLVKLTSREDKVIASDWSKPAVGECAITLVTLLWNKNYSPEDPDLIAAIKEELKNTDLKK